MGRPINKDQILSNLQVTQYRRADETSTSGRSGVANQVSIIRQQSKNKFRLTGVTSGTAWEESMTLVDSMSGSNLAPGTFIIRARDDDGDEVFVSRLYNRTVRLKEGDGFEKDSYSKSHTNADIVTGISGVSVSSNTVTITTPSNHLLKTGDSVTIADVAGGTVTNINGTFSITRSSPTRFTYTSTSAAIATYTANTGTVTKNGSDENLAYIHLKG